jgi:hypothetical protein
MSIPDRIVKISKTYMGQVRDRIDGALSEREDALRELEGDADSRSTRPSSLDKADDIMRRAEEKVAAARREMDASRELRPASASSAASPTVMPSASAEEASHYKVLGIPPGSDYSAVQFAYEKLVKRLDATRFDSETDRAEAARILERVNVAYDALRSQLDPTTNRFGKLEL